MVLAVLVVLTVAADARNKRISLGARQTDAVRAMVLWQTLGVSAALHSAVSARVEAFLVVASLLVRTVGV